jgi:hypothetical protein
MAAALFGNLAYPWRGISCGKRGAGAGVSNDWL